MEPSVLLLLLMITIIVATDAAATTPNPDHTSTDFDAIDRHDHAMHPEDDELGSTRPPSARETRSQFWLNNAQHFVERQLHKLPNRRRAKNIVIFIGDGMSATTIAATRPYIRSEETFLSWERFPAVGSAKTYCVDLQVPDSACTSTAYLCGVKTNILMLGVTANVTRDSCTAGSDPVNQVSSIAQWAVDAGKVVGLVTNAAVTTASPAGLYAHSANRFWENDNQIDTCDPALVPDIARQLIESDLGSQFRVILGGGRGNFHPNTTQDEGGNAGWRGDGRDLIAEWQAKKANVNASYVWNATELRSLDIRNEVDYLLGLFSPGNLPHNADVQQARSQDSIPALHEMTRTAIELLRKNDEGFFLFVENDNIDMAHHATFARLALDETVELSKAVEVARAMLPDDDTLIVVTSDHSHTMTYAGYPARGNDVTGKSGSTSADQLEYMTLSYANGPGFQNHKDAGGRVNLNHLDTTDPHFRFPAMAPREEETHAGEDIAVYATGPWSHLFGGNYEQNVIPYLMAYASCLNGLGPDSCTI